jgi:hypothetical protein
MCLYVEEVTVFFDGCKVWVKVEKSMLNVGDPNGILDK